MRQDNAKLQSLLANEKATASSVRVELEQLRAEHVEDVRRLQDENQQLQTRVVALQAENTALRVENDMLRDRVLKLEADLAHTQVRGQFSCRSQS
jgi:regulator of replication initiation timing